MKYSIIELSGGIRETGKLAKSISGSRGRHFRLDQYRARIEEIIQSKSKDRILIDCKSDFHPVVFAGLSVVRRGLERLKETGRELHFCGRDFSPVQLYLASICNYRYINLCGSLSYLGLSRTFNFFKGTLDKHGVEVQVFRRGKYKSANDSFRLKKLDSANREQWEEFYTALDQELRERILSGYGKAGSDIDELISGRMLSSEEAVSEGWVDGIFSPGELADSWKKEKIRKRKTGHGRTSFGSGTGIGILHFEGAIMEGRSRQHPVMGQILGADSYIPEIKRLKKNRGIKGVVLRVNCPGGSPVASDEVAGALEELAKEKPLVVSMGDVAGSGGYWISTQGRRIFAEKTTVTGSIGVVAMMIQAVKLMKEWGISQEALKTGPHADFGSPGRSLTAREKKIMDERIESLYSIFLKKVADSREKTAEEIHEVAQGRIWSGAEAVRLGLADEVGGIDDALEFIKGELKSKKIKVSHFPVIKPSFLERQLSKANPASAVILNSFLFKGLFSSLSTASEIMKDIEVWTGRPLVLIPELVDEFRKY